MQPSKKSDNEGGMEQRFSLEAAGNLLGVSANAVRARVKKKPEDYRFERDNGGKIWLWLDPENLPYPRKRKSDEKGSSFEGLKPSIKAKKGIDEVTFEVERLRGEVEAERKLRQAAEADRDRWQTMAEKLADHPRRWWPWQRS